MTGEITLRGDILPVGGLKEKIIGAKKAGIKKVFLPKDNEEEVKLFDKEITSGIRFVYVENYLQVFENLVLVKKIKKQVRTTVKK
jgi:ATP-dependent Lon protease